VEDECFTSISTHFTSLDFTRMMGNTSTTTTVHKSTDFLAVFVQYIRDLKLGRECLLTISSSLMQHVL